jgi:DNA-binding winged helix-turn-helix (wHTH) protein/TolB-like protein/cytochrome c-type biogenesis protein CcmH/NrfG
VAIDKQDKVLYEFSVFRLDPEERLLLCRGESVPLTPKAFDTLLLLVENGGHVLKKDELIEKLWPDSFVGENSLAQNISALRKALDEGSGEQQHIETLPRLGYRFSAPVTKVHPQDVSAKAVPKVGPEAEVTNGKELPAIPGEAFDEAVRQEARAKDNRRRLTMGVALALGLAVLAGLAYLIFVRRTQISRAQAPRLAVLPFRNIKEDPETDFLGFSLADVVITKLKYVSKLNVRPSAQVEKYRNQTIDPQQVAKELDVDLLLTGNFIKEGDNLRITSQLVDVTRNEIVWRDTIDLMYDKLITVQDEVTARVIRGLQLNLSPTEKQNLALDTPANPLAYEYFLRGADLYSRNDFSTAINMLEKTVSLDPNFALAWAHLGRTYNALASFALEGGDAYDKAFKSYEKALQLNPQEVEPRIYLANAYTDTGRVNHAIPLLKETLEAHPNLAEAHWELGYAYRFGGMLDESIAECEEARRLDPKVKIYSSAINAYLYKGEYGKFLQSLPATDTIAYIVFYRGFGNYYLKNWSSATADFDHAYQLAPSLYSQVGAALSKSIAGNKDQGLALLRDLEDKIQQRNVRDAEGVYKVAQGYAILGDKASALRVLRRSIDGGFVCYPYFASDPLLESLHNESEFAQLLELTRTKHEEFKHQFFPGVK